MRDEWTPWKSDDSLCGGGSRSEKNENETDFIGGYEGINESFTDDELLSLDSEGRCVMTQHKIMLVVSNGFKFFIMESIISLNILLKWFKIVNFISDKCISN